MPREIRFWTGVPGGHASLAELGKPFAGTGLRVPFASGAWAVIDLPTKEKEFFARVLGADFLISINVRSLRMGVDPLPTLSVTPSAGNWVTVRIGDGSHNGRELVVLPVNASSLTGSDQDAARTQSGDRLGEAALNRSPREATEERFFEIDHGGVSSVRLQLDSSDEADLILHVGTDDKQALDHPESFPSLHMFIFPHAANSISVCFREHTASFASPRWKAREMPPGAAGEQSGELGVIPPAP